MSVMAATRSNVCIADTYRRNVGKMEYISEDYTYDDGGSEALDDDIRSMEFGNSSVCGADLETKEEEYEDFVVIIEDSSSEDDSSSSDEDDDDHEPTPLQRIRMKKRMIENQLAGWREGNQPQEPRVSRRNSTGSLGDASRMMDLHDSTDQYGIEPERTGTHSRSMPPLVDFEEETTPALSRRWSCTPKSPTPEHSGRASVDAESIMSMVEFSSPETNKPKRRARRPSLGSALKKELPISGNDPVAAPVTTGGWISDIMGLSDHAPTHLEKRSQSIQPRSGAGALDRGTTLSPEEDDDSIYKEPLKPQSLPALFAKQTSHTTVDSYETLRSFSMQKRQVPRMSSGVSMASTIESTDRGGDDSLPRPLKAQEAKEARPRRRRQGRRNSTGDRGIFAASKNSPVNGRKPKHSVPGRRASMETASNGNFGDHVDSTHLMRTAVEEEGHEMCSSYDVAPARPERQQSNQSFASSSFGDSVSNRRIATELLNTLGHRDLRSEDEKGMGTMSMKKYAPVTYQLKEEINQFVVNPPQPLSGRSLWKGSNDTACTSTASSFRSSADKPSSFLSTSSAKRRGKKKNVKKEVPKIDEKDRSSSSRPKTLMNRLNIFKSKGTGSEKKSKRKQSRRSSMNGDLSGPNMNTAVPEEKHHRRPRSSRSRRRASTGTSNKEYLDDGSSHHGTATGSLVPRQPAQLATSNKRRAGRRLSLGVLNGRKQ